ILSTTRMHLKHMMTLVVQQPVGMSDICCPYLLSNCALYSAEGGSTPLKECKKRIRKFSGSFFACKES
uniref:Uncharacterized protein n=1 Tax=Podarcis muralis TaxID=64176 RepID=A0A670IR79_PODMU